MDSLRGSSVKIGTIQGRLAWPLRKDDVRRIEKCNQFCRCQKAALILPPPPPALEAVRAFHTPLFSPLAPVHIVLPLFTAHLVETASSMQWCRRICWCSA